MIPRKYENTKVESDTRFIDLPDGSFLMTIAVFKDGKFQGMTMYHTKPRRVFHECQGVL